MTTITHPADNAALIETKGTDLIAPCNAASTLATLQAMTIPLSESERMTAEAVMCAPLPPLTPTDAKHFAACMVSLSILPRRADDDVKGEVRHRIYESCLNHLPRAQLDWVTQQWIKTQKWFPQVSELLDLARKWERRDASTRCKVSARHLLEADAAHRPGSGPARPLTQDDVDGWSGPWRAPLISMGLACGALIEDSDGRVVLNSEGGV